MHVTYNPSEALIAVDGHDISKAVRRITIDHHGGRQPEVFLELAQGMTVPALEVEAVVTVVKAAEEDPAAVILAWLDGIDPGVLERAALEADTGLGGSTGQTFLDVLRGWVSGG